MMSSQRVNLNSEHAGKASGLNPNILKLSNELSSLGEGKITFNYLAKLPPSTHFCFLKCDMCTPEKFIKQLDTIIYKGKIK